MADFVFTRYLYEKDEAKLALLISILYKKYDALFWAYEIYYSGFVTELIDFLWKIYYDFYATLNPSFEKRLLAILNNDLALEKNEINVYIIVNEFMVRPFNTDIFILYQLMNFDLENNYLADLSDFEKMKLKFIKMIEEEDYVNIASYIIKDCDDKHLDNIVELYTLYFNKYIKAVNYAKNIKNIVSLRYDKRKLILVQLLTYCSVLKNKKLGKNICIDAVKEDFECYKHSQLQSQPPVKIPVYRTLQHFCKYSIDSHKHLSLFCLKRDINDIKDAYLNNWLYFASFSPIWKERITEYNGIIDYEEKKVVFNNDTNFEEFYNKYNYEPDEQSKEIQDKCIQGIQNCKTWKSFYEDHCKNCLVEIESDCLDEIAKISYC